MRNTGFRTLSLRFITLWLCLIFSVSSHSQSWRKEALSAIDKNYMQQQRDQINELAQRNFGRSLNGTKNNDFPIMQRLLDEKVVKPEQVQVLQAMGVILGDELKKEQGLSWTVYIDKYGRSKALNIPGQRDVVFPITMISRRYQTGAQVNIETVYQKAIASIEHIKKQIIVY